MFRLTMSPSSGRKNKNDKYIKTYKIILQGYQNKSRSQCVTKIHFKLHKYEFLLIRNIIIFDWVIYADFWQ